MSQYRTRVAAQSSQAHVFMHLHLEPNLLKALFLKAHTCTKSAKSNPKSVSISYI